MLKLNISLFIQRIVWTFSLNHASTYMLHNIENSVTKIILMFHFRTKNQRTTVTVYEYLTVLLLYFC